MTLLHESRTAAAAAAAAAKESRLGTIVEKSDGLKIEWDGSVYMKAFGAICGGGFF